MRFNGSTWFDRTNYFETFTASDENLDWALAMEADRMVNSFVARKDLDTEMTVVRNEIESGENNPWRVLWPAAAGGGVRLAQLRQRHDRRALRRRERRHRPAAGVLPHVLPARQRGADRRRHVRSGRRRSAGSRRTSAPIPKPTRTLPRLYTEEPVQDGERSVTVRRVGDAQLVGVALPHGARRASGLRSPSTRSAEIMTIEPAGRLYKALVETKKASGGRELRARAARSRLHHLLGAGAADGLARRGARRAGRHARGRPRDSRSPPPRSTACARRRCARLRRDDQRSAALRRRAVRVDRARRLAALLPAARPLAQADRRRRAARGARATSSPRTGRSAQFMPDAKPDRAPAPRRGRRRRDGQGLQGRPGGRRRRVVRRRRRPTSRRARSASRCRTA